MDTTPKPEIKRGQTLNVSEQFYSIQGEGPTAGMPAVFLRLGGCILNCAWCDTEAVWKKYDTVDILEFVAKFYHTYRFHFEHGARLIITGGSPMMQRASVETFIEEFSAKFDRVIPDIEIETEGVLAPNAFLQRFVTQWNVSPKLGNSGMLKDRALNVDTLKLHVSMGNSYFKFPVRSLRDVDELRELLDYLQDRGVNIPRSRTYLMPVASTREQYHQVAPIVVELCKVYHFRFSPRLQIEIWDKATGV